MQLPPIDVYLSWPVGNYTHPSELRGPAVLVLTLIFVPTLLVLVALRAYTRLRLTNNFGLDDVAIVAAVFPTLGCAIITLIAVLYHGWDRHVWDVPVDQLGLALKLAMAVEVLFSVACSLTRLSILFLVCRIMAAGKSTLRRLTIGMMVLVCMEEFVFFVVSINTCSPVSDYWTLSIGPQKCMNESAHILAAGLINTVTDFVVVAIPIPVVLKLKLPWRQRLFCAVLFGTGFIVCIAGAARIVYTYQLNTSYDKTWLFYPTWICGTVELYLGIIATSIPAIKPLVTRYFPNFLGATTTGHHQLSEQYLKSPNSDAEQGLSNPPLSRIDLNMAKGSARKHVATEKHTPVAKGKPVMLPPIVSAFSTYRMEENQEGIGTADKCERSENSSEGIKSSNSSISTFNAA